MTQHIDASLFSKRKQTQTTISETDTLAGLKHSAPNYAKIILEYDGNNCSNTKEPIPKLIVNEIKNINDYKEVADCGKRNAFKSIHHFFARLASLVPEMQNDDYRHIFDNLKNFVQQLTVDFYAEEPQKKVPLLTEILFEIARNFNDEIAKAKQSKVMIELDDVAKAQIVAEAQIFPKILFSSASNIVSLVSKYYIDNPIKVVRTSDDKICPAHVRYFISLVRSYHNMGKINLDLVAFNAIADACLHKQKDITDFNYAFYTAEDNPRIELSNPLYFTNIYTKIMDKKLYTKENYPTLYIEEK